MKTKTFSLIFLSLFFLVVSCQKQSVKIKPILQKAETLLEQHPDSALVLLEEIPGPQSFNKSLYYQYYLIYIQAKDKSYQDITSDTLIFNMQKYYGNKNGNENAAIASFYCGRTRQDQKKYEAAIEIFSDTEEYLKQSNNNNLKGLEQSSIGAIYYEQLLLNNAIPHYKKAEKYFQTAENYRNEAIMDNSIGDYFLMLEETDSAFVYYYKALALADKNSLKKEQNSSLA